MKNLFLILLVATTLLVGCSKKDETQPIKDKKEQNVGNNKEKPTSEEKKYWVNSSSNVIHNRTCRWYNNTKRGYFTDECTGKSCGICGGCE